MLLNTLKRYNAFLKTFVKTFCLILQIEGQAKLNSVVINGMPEIFLLVFNFKVISDQQEY